MLTKQEIVQNFILNAEKERVRRNLTQAQMAKKLEMSLSGYKKMVAGSTAKIDLYTVYLLHILSGKWIFELIDERPREAAFVSKLKEMTPNQLNFVDSLVEFEIAFSDSITAAEKNCDDYITVFIPTGNMEDGMIYDSTHYMKVDVSAYRQKFGDDMHCGLLVTSSHLHPVFIFMTACYFSLLFLLPANNHHKTTTMITITIIHMIHDHTDIPEAVSTAAFISVSISGA